MQDERIIKLVKELKKEGLVDGTIELDEKTYTVSDDNKFLTPFFHTSTLRIVLLSMLTFKTYEIYWMYKNWNFIRQRYNNKKILPLLMSVFHPFFFHSLLKYIKRDKALSSKCVLGFSPALLTIAWLIFWLTASLVYQFSLVIFALIPTFLVPAYIQSIVNDCIKKSHPDLPYEDVSPVEILSSIFGTILWVYLILGGF